MVLAALAVILALISGYASRALFNPDQFADRAAAALQDKAVSDELGRRVADELVITDPNLIAVRPVIEDVLSSVVRSGAFAERRSAAPPPTCTGPSSSATRTPSR